MANHTDQTIQTKQTLKTNIPEIIALVGAIAGLAVYLVTSTTGYMAGQGVSVAAIALSVVAIVALIVKIVLGSRLGDVLNDVLTVGSEALLIGGFALFVLARVRLAADIYFIPVNYPASEETALNISVIGVACYLIAIIALIVKAFTAKDVARAVISVEPAAPAVA